MGLMATGNCLAWKFFNRLTERPARPDHPPAHRSLFRVLALQVPGSEPPMPALHGDR